MNYSLLFVPPPPILRPKSPKSVGVAYFQPCTLYRGNSANREFYIRFLIVTEEFSIGSPCSSALQLNVAQTECALSYKISSNSSSIFCRALLPDPDKYARYNEDNPKNTNTHTQVHLLSSRHM